MKQLSGLDASFLYMETGRQFGHVTGLGVFRRPDEPGWSPYDALVGRLNAEAERLEPFRRRVVEVPFDLDHPYWITDPDFDLEFHVRTTALPPPGSITELQNLAARLIATPLDRTRPLWEIYVIEGLSDGRFAVLTKLHHATIDGAAGAELMTLIYDPDSQQRSTPVAPPVVAEPVPSPGQVLRRALFDVARKPGKFARLQVRSLRAIGDLTRNEGITGLAELLRTLPNPVGARLARIGRPPGDPDKPMAPPVSSAPPTPFNGSITAHRRVALRSVSLEQIKETKKAVGATVNDVVMAACAGALRTWLAERDALPDAPLVAMVPVSIRSGAEADPWTNRVSAVFPPIPTDSADPVERLDRVHAYMDEAKDRFLLLPADVITEYAEFAPPALAIRAARVAARLRIGDRLRPPFNLVISNVPGPRTPLRLGGAELEAYYPVSTIVDGQGLNITLQSYMGRLDFAMVSCRELLPDLDHLADLLVDEFDSLHRTLVPGADGDAAAPAAASPAGPIGAAGAVVATPTAGAVVASPTAAAAAADVAAGGGAAPVARTRKRAAAGTPRS
ncbi:MAG TPA: wax ester/triacylglycerol synthase family O-acyltransferase [Acidimicrobiales bacterium]|nr:wax ester/triacylglycerol synthase family O-acyltransferase [Acidimicrobiales bacterium]